MTKTNTFGVKKMVNSFFWYRTYVANGLKKRHICETL